MKLRHDTHNPTPAELEILSVLWRVPGATVREIHGNIPRRGTGYTTVLKTLQIMTEKQLVSREYAGRAHRYFAAVEEVKVQRSLVGELVDRAFGGAAHNLVLHALSERKPSAEELEEIRSLLDSLERNAN